MLEGPHILVAPHDHICGRADDDSADDRCRVACCSVGLGAVALPNFRHSSSSARHAAQRHSAVHIPKAHPGRAGQHAAAAGHHAVGARPASGADTRVSSPHPEVGKLGSVGLLSNWSHEETNGESSSNSPI